MILVPRRQIIVPKRKLLLRPAQAIQMSYGSAGSPPSGYAIWDTSRKGSGVTLSGGSLTATINGLYMVAATNPIDISGSTGYYAEFAINGGSTSFVGFGLARSDSTTDTYLGAYANQFCYWADGSYDTVSGVSKGSFLYNYQGSLGGSPVIQWAVKSGQAYFGINGTGWWNASADNFTGDPAAGTGATLTSFTSGNWSMAMSCITSSTAVVTANFGASSWTGTPPSGFVGWPG